MNRIPFLHDKKQNTLWMKFSVKSLEQLGGWRFLWLAPFNVLQYLSRLSVVCGYFN